MILINLRGKLDDYDQIHIQATTKYTDELIILENMEQRFMGRIFVKSRVLVLDLVYENCPLVFY